MKIQTRDVGLLSIGFVLGAVVAVSLISTPARIPTAPAVVGTGTVLAAASPQITLVTNFQLHAQPMRDGLLDSFDLQSPLYPGHRPVDLIDTRYQPDMKLQDLR